MKIGLLQINIYIAESRSIKDKRTKLAKLKSNLRKDFNISIAEIGDREKWQSIILGILILGNKTSYVQKRFEEMLKYIKKFRKLQIIDYNIQLI